MHDGDQCQNQLRISSAQLKRHQFLTSGLHLSYSMAGDAATQFEDSSTNFTAMKTPIQKTPTLPRSRTFSASLPVPTCTCFASVRTPAKTECCLVNCVYLFCAHQSIGKEDNGAVPPCVRRGDCNCPKSKFAIFPPGPQICSPINLKHYLRPRSNDDL